MQASTATQITIPEIGAIWPGQGGIYAGVIPARNSKEAYHLIIGAEVGRFEWGPYDEESPAKSLIDGQANTKALLESGGDYPAAKAAAMHQAEGHADFYLPAIAELNEAWMNLGDQSWGWLWSSTQFSARYAYFMDFSDGLQSYGNKNNVRSVRPVRRLIC